MTVRKLAASAVGAVVVLCSYPQVATPEEARLVSRAALVLDARDGRPLYSKNPDQRMYPASTTKVLTAILAIESGRMNEIVDVHRSDTWVVPSSIGLTAGEKIRLRDLVYGLILSSGNDAARAIARHLAGSQEAFAQRMNQRALQLGCRASHFVNAHGLPHRYHYTTARDLARIMRHAMTLEEFRKVVSTREYLSQGRPKKRVFRNKNKLLHLYEGTLGGKPGYTRAAQQTLVAAAQRDGVELVVVCLHSIGKSVWTDAMRLFNIGFERAEDRRAALGSGAPALPVAGQGN